MAQPLNFRYPPGTAFSDETIGHAWKYGTFSSVTIGVVFEYGPSQRSLYSVCLIAVNSGYSLNPKPNGSKRHEADAGVNY